MIITSNMFLVLVKEGEQKRSCTEDAAHGLFLHNAIPQLYVMEGFLHFRNINPRSGAVVLF